MVGVAELRAARQEHLVMLETQVPRLGRYLEVARVPVHQHAMAEQREQRRPDPRREVPQQVGGPEELREPALADAVGARRAKILLVLPVHDQERADIAEAVLLEPLEEELRQTLIIGLRTRRDEHVQPEYIVAQVTQT